MMSRFIDVSKPVLHFFISIVGTMILASVAGVLGAFAHIYFGLALFIVILIMGFVGSIKEYWNLNINN